MTISVEQIAPTYVQLALAIEQHKPGYVDAYYGPSEWQDQAKAKGLRPLVELAQECADLNTALAADTNLDPQRRDFLTKQGRAMQTSLRILQGEQPALVEETETLYDITPAWMDEIIFDEAQRRLDELLPAGDLSTGGSLIERMAARKKAVNVTIEPGSPLLDEVIVELQRRTTARFSLPPDESFEVQLVTDKPWSAYNWYLGNFRSLIEINIDRPIDVIRLVHLMAHEGYPGHHTELSIKEARLTREQGWIEHAITLLDSAACVIAEGIATRALTTLMSDEELVDWCTAELLPRAGLAHLDARRELAIETARVQLAEVSNNAAFLLFEQAAGEAELVAYLQRYGLSTEQEAQQTIRFLKYARSYIFTYRYGGEILDALFAKFPDHDHWFARLLSEAVTPSQIRAWLE